MARLDGKSDAGTPSRILSGRTAAARRRNLERRIEARRLGVFGGRVGPWAKGEFLMLELLCWFPEGNIDV